MKFMEKLQKRRKDNKGFSLVELIIVIAIMAILVGIVGTQVVPYLERARVSKDQQILSGLLTDMVAATSMNAGTMTEATYKITIKDNVTITPNATGDGSGQILATFTELNGITKLADLKLSSSEGKKISQIDIEYKAPSVDPSGATVRGGTKMTLAGLTNNGKFGVIESL